MSKEYDFLNKRVLVIGLGISGMGAAKLLRRLGAFVIVNEEQELPADDKNLLELSALGITYYGGGHDVAYLENVDYVVKNPGIPYYAPFIKEIVKRGIPILTEPEIAMQACKGKVVALTGTNGKTTTTMLIHSILNKYFDEVYVAGNIGVAFSEVVTKASENSIIVLELSSFQLMGMPTFTPDVALVLNFNEAHLDYHKDFTEYVETKLHIFENMTKGEVILNYDDATLMQLAESRVPQGLLKTFSMNNNDASAYITDDGFIMYGQDEVCHIEEVHVPGAHNLQNVLAAIIVAKHFNVPNDYITKALQKFAGVEHRLEYVKTLHKRKIYNDSKSTNVKAAQVALAAFQQPIVWIAGGLDRGNDIEEIRPFTEQVKAIVAYGQSQEKFAKLADKLRISVAKVETLEEATFAAYDFSDPDDIILLSPACASWDQFKNFEERGTIFKEIVNQLK